MSIFTVIFFGDLVGSPGRKLFKKHCALLKKKHNVDMVIVNGENSADGRGITPQIADELFSFGATVITTGNHIWDKKEVYPYLEQNHLLLRPANYPPGCPGVGFTILECGGQKVGVINLMGRVFMNVQSDCPFRSAQEIIQQMRDITPLIFVDFHAETTSEKLGIGFFLDGKVSAVVGTHTHIQTSDARILPQGTAYITDLGMAGSLNSMIGVTVEPLLFKFLQQMPTRHEVSKEAPFVISGLIVKVDTETGKSVETESFYSVDSDPL